MDTAIFTLLIWVVIIIGGYYFTSRLKGRRWFLWLGFLLTFLLVERLHSDTHVILRMVVLCTTILALMKVIVYAEWSRQTGKALAFNRWLMFAVLWFGMEPAAWAGERRRLSWGNDCIMGLSCLAVGWGTCVILAKYEMSNIIVVFIPMSMVFHFGALRLLVAFWRMCGFPVRALFRNPLASKGVADFWSSRWNLSFSQMMARTVKRPMQETVGIKAAIFSVFIASGLLHELAITIPVKGGYGLPLFYFLAHGIIVFFEKDTWPLWRKRSFTLVIVVLPLPFLFPQDFTNEIILPCLKLAAADFNQILTKQ